MSRQECSRQEKIAGSSVGFNGKAFQKTNKKKTKKKGGKVFIYFHSHITGFSNCRTEILFYG